MEFQIPTGINSPDTRYITFWRVGLNGVADSWMHNDVAYSYGMIYTTNNKFKFRSPNVHYGGAYFVISDGAFGVDWYIGNSYGSSPRYDISINACSVDNVGDVDYYIDGVSYDSCGCSPGIGYVDGAYRVGSDGDCVNSGSDGIMHNSYGISLRQEKISTALRTSTATTVRASFIRMVMSTTATV